MNMNVLVEKRDCSPDKSDVVAATKAANARLPREKKKGSHNVGYTDTAQTDTVYKYTIPSNTEMLNQKYEPTTGELVDNLDVTASPCHVGDSRYSTIQLTLFDPCILRDLFPTHAFAPP